MKNLFFLLLAACLLFSCAKEDVSSVDKDVSISTKNSEFPASAADVTLENGMLVFQDYAHLETVVEGLYAELEQHEDDFNEQYGHLTFEEMDNIEEETGWDVDQPLIDFENNLDFKSRRAMIREMEEAWLAQSDIDVDFANNPNNLDFHSPEMRAVLNKKGEVKVGDEVWDAIPKGGGGEGCWLARNEFDSDEYRNETRRWEIKTEADSWPHLVKLHCRTCNFKKRSNGSWRKSRTNMTAQVNGRGRLWDNCNSTTVVLGNTKSRKTKCLHVRARVWAPPATKFRDLEVCGSGNYNDNEVFEIVCIDTSN